MSSIFYTIIIYPIVQIIEFVFVFAQKLFKETGLSIIFVSGAVSILCLPLYMVAENWQEVERNIQKNLAPKIAKIKAAFTGDERYMILSTYYRQNHYHPVYAMRSTFGLLIQIPFFIAAYSYLSHLELLNGSSFLVIPDLGKPDALLPIAGGINLLPILMTVINCAAGAIYTRGLAIKDKFQVYGMSLLFLLLLYNSPSGLVLYWTLNNVFSLLKNIYFQIKIKYKHYLLMGLSSLCFVLLILFCIYRYHNSSMASKVIFICAFAVILPWLIVIFKKKLLKIIDIKDEPVKSLAVFLLSISLIWCLFGLFIPSQLITSSPQEFSFLDDYTNPLVFIFITAFQVFGFFVFWPVCLYFLFPDNIKKYLSFVFLAISIGILVNTFLFSGNYGIISINFVYNTNISHTTGEILFNFCILTVILIAIFMLYKLKNRNIILIPVSLFVFSLLGISVINSYKINVAFNELKKYYVKEEDDVQEVSPLFTLSRNGKNIVVIMLDRAISVFVPFIFDEYPELKEKYSGFSYYPNTVSFNGYTSMGTPPLFGGYEYTPEEINKRDTISLVEKHNQSLLMLPRIFCENGFSVFVTDPPYANYNWKSDLSIFNDYPDIKAYITDSKYTDSWIREHDLKLPEIGAIIKRNMFWYSFIKGLPLFFRQPLYMDGDWCSPIPGCGLRFTLNGYSVLDYLPRLIEITDKNIDTALIMTNNTTHEGSLLQAPEYKPVINVTNYGKGRFSKISAFHINAAAIKRLVDWFEFLKRENIYDNTRIILVSDHGPEDNFITKIGLPINVDQLNPLLMVKDFNATGEIKTDTSFMSNADVPYLSLTDIIDNPINPFTGNEITTKAKENPLYIAISGSIHIQNRQDSQYEVDPKKDYYVHDNIFDKNNWIRADIYQAGKHQP
jgi:YidC/Oxa1 family membrane protein insertase